MIPDEYKKRIESFVKKEYSVKDPNKGFLFGECLHPPANCGIGDCPIAIFDETAGADIEINGEKREVCGNPFFVTEKSIFPTLLKNLKKKHLKELKKSLSYLIVIDSVSVHLDQKVLIGYWRLKKNDLREIERFFELYQTYRRLSKREKEKLWLRNDPEKEIEYVVECREFGIDEDCEFIYRESNFIEIYYALEELHNKG